MSHLRVPPVLPLIPVESDSDSDGGSGAATPVLRYIPHTLLLPVAPKVTRRHSWICG